MSNMDYGVLRKYEPELLEMVMPAQTTTYHPQTSQRRYHSHPMSHIPYPLHLNLFARCSHPGRSRTRKHQIRAGPVSRPSTPPSPSHGSASRNLIIHRAWHSLSAASLALAWRWCIHAAETRVTGTGRNVGSRVPQVVVQVPAYASPFDLGRPVARHDFELDGAATGVNIAHHVKGGLGYRMYMRRNRLLARALSPPSVMLLIQPLNVQFNRYQSHGRETLAVDGILHWKCGVRYKTICTIRSVEAL